MLKFQPIFIAVGACALSLTSLSAFALSIPTAPATKSIQYKTHLGSEPQEDLVKCIQLTEEHLKASKLQGANYDRHVHALQEIARHHQTSSTAFLQSALSSKDKIKQEQHLDLANQHAAAHQKTLQGLAQLHDNQTTQSEQSRAQEDALRALEAAILTYGQPDSKEESS